MAPTTKPTPNLIALVPADAPVPAPPPGDRDKDDDRDDERDDDKHDDKRDPGVDHELPAAMAVAAKKDAKEAVEPPPVDPAAASQPYPKVDLIKPV